jgi:hypothetical protein
MVTCTVFVIGSAFSSHTCSSRSSELSSAGAARNNASRRENSLAAEFNSSPSRTAPVQCCQGKSERTIPTVTCGQLRPLKLSSTCCNLRGRLARDKRVDHRAARRSQKLNHWLLRPTKLSAELFSRSRYLRTFAIVPQPRLCGPQAFIMHQRLLALRERS